MTRPTPEPAPDNGRRSALLVVGVVFVAIIATLVAVLVLNRPTETAGPTGPSPSERTASAPPSVAPDPSDEPSDDPEPSDTPVPMPEPAPEDWTLVHTFGVEGTRWVGGEISYGDAGFLAVGRQWGGGEGGPRVTDNTMWLSPDGRTWTEVPYPSGPEFGYFFRALTGTSDGGYVLHANAQADGGSVAVALHSTDGMTWNEIETGLPEVTDILAIEEGPSGYLLVNGQTGGGNPSLWLSDDAKTWEMVHEFAQDEGYVQLADGDGGAEGYVVIGRRIEFEGGPYQRFSFASADGREWVERAEPFGPDDQDFVGDTAVSSMGGDWVATLSMRDDTTSTWVSADGLEWEAAGAMPVRNESVAIAGLLEEVDGEVIASPGGGMDFAGTPGVFSSTDGATWTPVDLGADAWLSGLTIGDGLVAAIGTIPIDDTTSQLAIWVRAAG